MNGLPALAKGFWARKPVRGRDELSFLPAALEIIETPASPAGRATAMLIVGVAAFAIIWAGLGRVDIVVSSQGRIEPVGNSKVVQPFQTGVVQAILVQNDQVVTAGQALIELDPTDAAADQIRLTNDLRQARLDQARLAGLREALLSGQPPQLANPPANAPLVLLEAAQAAMQAQYAGQAAKLADLDAQIAGQREKNGEAEASLAELQASLGYAQQMANVRNKAMTLGVGDKLDSITANQQLSQQQHQVAVLQMQAVEATSAAQALVAQRAQTVADYQTSVLSDLVKADAQVSQDQDELTKASNLLQLMTLRAPITGTVQELAIHTVGGVVTPAQSLLVVVPKNPDLDAQVRIANRDIGFVHVGQEVQLKIAAYDFTRYGTIPGKVVGISHDVEDAMPVAAPNQAVMNGTQPNAANSSGGNVTTAQQDAQAGSYLADIRLERRSIQTEQGTVPLTPGMELTADIKTGRRSIMSYLLSPINMLKKNAMRQ
jgi:hemolysin D